MSAVYLYNLIDLIFISRPGSQPDYVFNDQNAHYFSFDVYPSQSVKDIVYNFSYNMRF